MLLHDAGTVADAQAARQVLKVEIKAGRWKTSPERAWEAQKNVGTEVGTGEAQPPEKRVLKAAIKGYQVSRDLLGKKDPKTCKREDSGLKLWSAFKPDLAVSPESFDPKLLLAFAEWRNLKAKEKGRTIEGRSIDVNITALANVIRWCVINEWLPEFPLSWHWDALGESPEEWSC